MTGRTRATGDFGMNADTWQIEISTVKKELAEMLTLLSQNNPADVGIARRKHLLEHLERIRSQFLGLSRNL